MLSYGVYEEKGTALKNPKYQILNNRSGHYYFHLRARNGEVILTSVDFDDKQDCLEALKLIRDQADFDFVELQDTDRRLYSFAVVDPRGVVVGKSENYTTRLGRGNGIMAVMKIICEAPVEDLATQDVLH